MTFTDKMKYIDTVFTAVDAYMKKGDIQPFSWIASQCIKIDVEGYVRLEFPDSLVVTIGVSNDCLTIKNVVENIYEPEIRIEKYYKNMDAQGFLKAVYELNPPS